MITRTSLLRLFLLVTLTACSLVDDVAAQQTPMNFSFSYSSFAYDDTSSLVELAYQFSERALTYRTVEGASVGKLYLRLRVRDSLDRPLMVSEWITSNPAPAADDEDRVLMGLKSYALRPGRYRAQIYYEDMLDPARRDSSSFPLSVRGFSSTDLDVSDIEIVSDMVPSEEREHAFYKNGMLVYPNVTGSIVPPFLVLNTYMEVYNANAIPTSTYAVSYVLADSTGRAFYQGDEKRSRPASRAVVEPHSIVLSELPSGEYFLMVTAYAGLQRAARDSARVVRRFALYNPEIDSTLRAPLQPEARDHGEVIDPLFAGLTEAELEIEFQKVRPITVDRERDIWGEISGAEARARYLSEFWLRRDPTPGTAANEFRDDYQKRLATAHGLYRSPMTPNGWDSDRGRILLQYGKPSSIARHPSDYNRKPYEIWTYTQNNYQFVFVDRALTGTYLLVHSNAPSEIRDENWEQNYAMIDRTLERVGP